jgi:bidirectional [NiFe] hydrogenase diaphorase subunit
VAWRRQGKIVLENSSAIDPKHIEDDIVAGGYAALLKCLTSLTPVEVTEHLVHSGLRGCGGAGLPSGLKWSTTAKANSHRKFGICNADEGDPAAFMDRSVLESDPHRVLEGMPIGAYAVAANEDFIYVRAEYPLAVRRLHTVIHQPERQHLLGKNIAETTFSFHIDVRLGAGAFVVRRQH